MGGKMKGGGKGFGKGKGKGKGKGEPEGPPDSVTEMGGFLHPCEGELVVKSSNEKVPYFNAPIYLENKTKIGKAGPRLVKKTLCCLPSVKRWVEQQTAEIQRRIVPRDFFFFEGACAPLRRRSDDLGRACDGFVDKHGAEEIEAAMLRAPGDAKAVCVGAAAGAGRGGGVRGRAVLVVAGRGRGGAQAGVALGSAVARGARRAGPPQLTRGS